MDTPRPTARRVSLICLIAIASGTGTAVAKKPAPPVQGTVVERGGQTLLRVWGTPHEMGYAHGYLLRDRIIDIVGQYAVPNVGLKRFEAARHAFRQIAKVPAPLQAEVAAIVEGMRAAGGAVVPALGRSLDVDDLLLLNAYTALVGVGCSSVSAWGQSTAADPDLAGGLELVRNLDWSAHPALLRNQVVIAYAPSDPTRQPLVSVAFASFVGCLSCMNAAGVGAFFNMGDGRKTRSLGTAGAPFLPSNLALRDALERRDVDGDGKTTARDVKAALDAVAHRNSYIVHVIEPKAPGGQAPARVLEVDPRGVVVRSPDRPLLTATNHHRTASPALECPRYMSVEREVKRSPAWSSKRLWKLAEQLALPQVVHTLSVVPARRALSVRMRAVGLSIEQSPPAVQYDWKRLFPDTAAPQTKQRD